MGFHDTGVLSGLWVVANHQLFIVLCAQKRHKTDRKAQSTLFGYIGNELMMLRVHLTSTCY